MRVVNPLAVDARNRDGGWVLVRRELPGDVESVRAVHAVAFEAPEAGSEPIEVGLVDALRASGAWIPELSWVACTDDGVVVGHVVCTRGTVGSHPALGLGPIGVLPSHQGQGVGSALMHAVLGAADATGEPLVVLLGHLDYYPRFGFRPASELGIESPEPAWGDHFQARALTTWTPDLRGLFAYAKPFLDL